MGSATLYPDIDPVAGSMVKRWGSLTQSCLFSRPKVNARKLIEIDGDPAAIGARMARLAAGLP